MNKSEFLPARTQALTEALSKLLTIASKVAQRKYAPSLEKCRTISDVRAEVGRMEDLHPRLAWELKTILDELEPQNSKCKWCVTDGVPEWSFAARVWIHRRDSLDKACLNPPNSYGYTTQVPEERFSDLQQAETPFESVCGDCDTDLKCHGLGDCPKTQEGL